MIGQRFGKLVILSDLGVRNGQRFWLCQCDCGNETTCRTAALNNGHKASCGCLQKDHAASLGRSKAIHGGYESPEYRSWCDIRNRCYRTAHDNYARYGGRGIQMCPEWRDSFTQFLADMGPKPTPKHTIERIDNDGNYEPGNCRWSTRKEQANNRSSSHYVEAFGKRLTIQQWVEETGIAYNTIWNRLKRGVPAETALRK